MPTDIVRESGLSPLRIVFEHTMGRYAGLRQIVGTTDEFEGATPPTTSEPFNAIPDNRPAQAGLVSAHRGYLLYREINFTNPVRTR